MSGPWHPTGRGRVSSRSPSALGICDFCGFTYNRADLVWQYQWSGVKLQNLRFLVCQRTCKDIPQIQLKTIVIPPDPLPVWNPRPEQYNATIPNYIATESSNFSGQDLITEASVGGPFSPGFNSGFQGPSGGSGGFDSGFNSGFSHGSSGQAGENLIWEIGDEMLPDPNNPNIYYPEAANSGGST